MNETSSDYGQDNVMKNITHFEEPAELAGKQVNHIQEILKLAGK